MAAKVMPTVLATPMDSPTAALATANVKPVIAGSSPHPRADQALVSPSSATYRRCPLRTDAKRPS
ncbi:hypothetical protein MAHJHV64_18200 [Mycobacterium avium subsp. hominissuis]